MTHRPGDWGPLYDQVMGSGGDLVILRNEPDDEAYWAANHVILDQAIALAEEFHKPATAVLIWDGVSRGVHDLTEEFGVEARKRGVAVTEVRTG